MKATALKEKAIDILDHLPSSKLKEAIDYLEYIQGDFDTFDVNEKVKQSLHEVKLIREKKIKVKTLKEFLREL